MALSASSRRLAAIALSALALSATLAACGSTSTTTETAKTPSGGGSEPALQRSFVSVIGKVAPEVVQISTAEGLGSGVVFDGSSDIVTNAHVVAGEGPLKVTDSRGRTYAATLVGSFEADDLAVVRAEGASLPSATFANSGKLQVGDIVLALGNPLGLRSSVTNGIVSALGRTVGEPGGVVLPNTIQTSAPINPGNSGGALVDLEGKVVGIPTLAATDPQLGGAAVGIGFAIPSSIAIDVARQIVEHGHVVESHRAFLGVQLAAGLSSEAVVAEVTEGSPAEKAGIERGDVIDSIEGTSTPSPGAVVEALAKLSAGKTISIGITTPSGQQKTVKATLAQYPGGE